MPKMTSEQRFALQDIVQESLSQAEFRSLMAEVSPDLLDHLPTEPASYASLVGEGLKLLEQSDLLAQAVQQITTHHLQLSDTLHRLMPSAQRPRLPWRIIVEGTIPELNQAQLDQVIEAVHALGGDVSVRLEQSRRRP